jgi:hypothetical protein
MRRSSTSSSSGDAADEEEEAAAVRKSISINNNSSMGRGLPPSIFKRLSLRATPTVAHARRQHYNVTTSPTTDKSINYTASGCGSSDTCATTAAAAAAAVSSNTNRRAAASSSGYHIPSPVVPDSVVAVATSAAASSLLATESNASCFRVREHFHIGGALDGKRIGGDTSSHPSNSYNSNKHSSSSSRDITTVSAKPSLLYRVPGMADGDGGGKQKQQGGSGHGSSASTSSSTSSILSHRGTVRGFKNLVKAGVATFDQTDNRASKKVTYKSSLMFAITWAILKV